VKEQFWYPTECNNPTCKWKFTLNYYDEYVLPLASRLFHADCPRCRFSRKYFVSHHHPMNEELVKGLWKAEKFWVYKFETVVNGNYNRIMKFDDKGKIYYDEDNSV